MNQIGLPFDWPTQEDASDFIITPANASVIRHLEHWGSWPVRTSLLVGPRKSGRSLLGRIFSGRFQGKVLDDADHRPETELFHAWNAAQESRVPLLMIAERAPSEWDIHLPDLRSRLSATPVVRIDNPDLALAEALLTKFLAKRGLVMLPDMAAYVVQRLERTYIAIDRAADAIDAASLSQKRGISLPLVKHALIQAGLIDRRGGGGDNRDDDAGT